MTSMEEENRRTAARAADAAAGRTADRATGDRTAETTAGRAETVTPGRATHATGSAAETRATGPAPGRADDRATGRAADTTGSRAHTRATGRAAETTSGRTGTRATGTTAGRADNHATDPATHATGSRAPDAAGDPAAGRSAGLDERFTGALVGAAVGDALGGAVEGWSPEQIVRRHGGRVLGVVGPWHGDDWRTARPVAPYHKGDGHVTDDTLMTHALVRVYARVRDHLDAYAVADHLVPDLMTNPRWIPELEAEALPLQRIFLAEKWLVARLHYGHVDPREAGVGNIVNCGAAMYMAPVGLVNAAHPAAAYAEALDVAGAHQSSYGREAAGAQAAAVAAACAPGATPDSVVAACLSLAKDGTRAAIEAVCEAAARHTDFESALGPLREAVAPYDTVGPEYRSPSLGARRPSRLHAVEELPVALGMLVVSGGDFRHAVLGAVNYGRDCDSIATMAGALAGALGSPVPGEWATTVAEASRLDLWEPARTLAGVAREVFARDVARRRAHEDAFARIGGTACSG